MRGSSSTTKTLAFSTGCPLVCLAAGGATERQSRPARVKCIRGAKRARPRNTLILLGVPPYAGQSRVSETRQILHRCVIPGMARQIRGLSLKNKCPPWHKPPRRAYWDKAFATEWPSRGLSLLHPVAICSTNLKTCGLRNEAITQGDELTLYTTSSPDLSRRFW